MSEVTRSLEQAKKWKSNVTNKRIYARREAASAHARVKVLLERRKEIGRQLQLRKKEVSFLQQLQGQLRESEEEKREKEELREVLMHKDAEVRQLQEQLREVEKELECAREEAHSLRGELQRVTVELAEKSARVQELERTRDNLEDYLDWERRRVDMLLTQSTVSSNVLLKEIKVLACLWLCSLHNVTVLWQPDNTVIVWPLKSILCCALTTYYLEKSHVKDITT